MTYKPLPAPGADNNVMTSDGAAWVSEPGGGGEGAVDSVNGATGVVVLTAADVGADASGTAGATMGEHVADPDPHTQYHRTFGSATATFTGGADSVVVTVVDGGITAGSIIIPSVSMGTRDPDEFEMAPVAVAVGTITAGVGFTLVVTSLDGDAEGAYKINFITDDL